MGIAALTGRKRDPEKEEDIRRFAPIALGILVLSPGVLPTAAAASTDTFFTSDPSSAWVGGNNCASKLEVYLDGGLAPNAPPTAAGLADGTYIFRVTDASGKFLLSTEPAKRRALVPQFGLIVREVQATELGFPYDSYTTGGTASPCRIQDGNPAESVAGPSGRRDWNYDVDRGPTGIVIQLMPYGTSPSYRGGYQVWLTPVDTYRANRGNLEMVPVAASGKGSNHCPDFCAAPDPGFRSPAERPDRSSHEGQAWRENALRVISVIEKMSHNSQRTGGTLHEECKGRDAG